MGRYSDAELSHRRAGRQPALGIRGNIQKTVRRPGPGCLIFSVLIAAPAGDVSKENTHQRRHGTYEEATKERQKGENIPPRVTQGRTARAQADPQIQARGTSLQARKTALGKGQVVVGRRRPSDRSISPSFESKSDLTLETFFAADFFGFFFHAIPEGPRGCVLTLSEVHELVSDVWLARHDAELEEERAARRKGRPKSAKELKLEEVKLREAEEYRTGMGERAARPFL
jgi:hypothetical protein